MDNTTGQNSIEWVPDEIHYGDEGYRLRDTVGEGLESIPIIQLTRTGNKWQYDWGSEEGIIVTSRPAKVYDTLTEVKEACATALIAMMERDIEKLKSI